MALNISSQTVVSTVPSDFTRASARLVKVIVNTPGSAAGSVFDAASAAGAIAANLVFSIPNAVGIYPIDAPIVSGILVAPGTGQVLNVIYD